MSWLNQCPAKTTFSAESAEIAETGGVVPSVLKVSQSLDALRRRVEPLCVLSEFCDRAVLLEGGHILMDGDATEVSKRYVSMLTHSPH